MNSDEEIRRRYGDSAVISRAMGFVLVHLDRPTRAEVRERTDAFDPDDYFDPDCPLCELQRARRLVVFENYPDTGEEVLLE